MSIELKKSKNPVGVKGPVLTVVMDGVGLAKDNEGNAVKRAYTPTLDRLMAEYPMLTLKAHGTAVGLPSDDDMGNSEVGHNALGSGQVFAQGAKLEFDPGAATTVAGDVVFGGVEMVLKDGAEITEDVLVMKARSFSGAVSGKFGKFVARYRNAGTELWLGKDKAFVIKFR